MFAIRMNINAENAGRLSEQGLNADMPLFTHVLKNLVFMRINICIRFRELQRVPENSGPGLIAGDIINKLFQIVDRLDGSVHLIEGALEVLEPLLLRKRVDIIELTFGYYTISADDVFHDGNENHLFFLAQYFGHVIPPVIQLFSSRFNITIDTV
jgi:hypothetical protein